MVMNHATISLLILLAVITIFVWNRLPVGSVAILTSSAFTPPACCRSGPHWVASAIRWSSSSPHKFAEALGPFGGRVIKTSLSAADEKELADELATGSW
jgi:hypothetical protein